jgi:hypothetical protein
MITAIELTKRNLKLTKFQNRTLVFEVSKGSYLVHKFLCEIHKDKNHFFVEGNEPTNKIEVLEKQIRDHVEALPFNSEYYNPMLRPDLFVSLCVSEFLRKLGFKNEDVGLFILEVKSIYGNRNSFHLSIFGLETDDFKAENGEWECKLAQEVKISLAVGGYSFLTVTCERNVYEITKALNNLLKPLFISETLEFLKLTDNVKSFDGTSVISEINSKGEKTEDIRKRLKEQLLEMAEKL